MAADRRAGDCGGVDSDSALAEAARLYEQITGHTLTATGGEDLTEMVDEFGVEKVRYALTEAQRYQAHSPIHYMRGCLQAVARRAASSAGR